MLVVIPSNRGIELSYLAPLIESGARFIVVDDSEGAIRVPHPAFTVYNWADRRRMLGALDEHFPRRNGACRAFGFYVAWKESDAGEAIVALDDDCRVYREDFATAVESALSDAPRPVATSAGDHLNILDLYRSIERPLFPRGFPYSARANHQPARIQGTSDRPVLFSLGLWKGVFDINAVDKITGPAYAYPDAELEQDSVVVARNQLISVCSMNMQFRRAVLPAAYQFPMHIPVVDGGVIDRYGDIWGGFVLKALMDIKGDALAVGEPMIEHVKDGNYLRNIWQENLCHQINDEFLAVLGEVKETVRPGPYLDMMEALADALQSRTETASPMLRAYFDRLGPALAAWNRALRTGV